MEDFLDDRVIIPDYIQRMSNDELDAEIARLEAEAAAKKAQFYKEQDRRKIIGPRKQSFLHTENDKNADFYFAKVNTRPDFRGFFHEIKHRKCKIEHTLNCRIIPSDT